MSSIHWAVPLLSAVIGAFIYHAYSVRRSKVERAHEAHAAACVLREQFHALLHSYWMAQLMPSNDSWGHTLSRNRELFMHWEMTKTISILVSTIEIYFPNSKPQCYTAVSCIYKVSMLHIENIYVIDQISDNWKDIKDTFIESIESVCSDLAAIT